MVLEPKQDENGEWLLGFLGSGVRTRGNVFQTIYYSAYEVKYWISTTIKSLGMLFQGEVTADDVAGPVGIVDMIGDTYEQSIVYGIGTAAGQGPQRPGVANQGRGLGNLGAQRSVIE